jgi:hypothetical protein
MKNLSFADNPSLVQSNWNSQVVAFLGGAEPMATFKTGQQTLLGAGQKRSTCARVGQDVPCLCFVTK